jgi:hypothetical protein
MTLKIESVTDSLYTYTQVYTIPHAFDVVDTNENIIAVHEYPNNDKTSWPNMVMYYFDHNHPTAANLSKS